GNLALAGTMTVTNGSAVVIGVGTSFTSLTPFGTLAFSNSSNITYTILSIQSNTQLTLTTNFTGTSSSSVTATYGVWHAQLYVPIAVTFTGNGTLSKTLTVTPLSADVVTYTFTNTGSLTNQSPLSYVSTSEYFQDTFLQGAAGTELEGLSSL